ncbi:MAG: hypothetical protein U5O16_42315 [Rhodococcus sp. (in: high G+C Gram-positive bacteria)]|uniref:hypothetical protein n=1 Tax=Rhodococcus sp. TaxID=1831 RepID=UPI002AD9CC6C|nr:hypothetical protein [Rhodococcus sp. (in: high G+C Gram-positive bacteria)]
MAPTAVRKTLNYRQRSASLEHSNLRETDRSSWVSCRSVRVSWCQAMTNTPIANKDATAMPKATGAQSV